MLSNERRSYPLGGGACGELAQQQRTLHLQRSCRLPSFLRRSGRVVNVSVLAEICKVFGSAFCCGSSVHLRSTSWSHANCRRPPLLDMKTGRHANQRCQNRFDLPVSSGSIAKDQLPKDCEGCTTLKSAPLRKHANAEPSGANLFFSQFGLTEGAHTLSAGLAYARLRFHFP